MEFLLCQPAPPGMGTALQCDWNTEWHSNREKFSHWHQVLVADSFLVMEETLSSLSILNDLTLFDFNLCNSCVSCHSLCVFMYELVSRRHYFPLALTIFSPSLHNVWWKRLLYNWVLQSLTLLTLSSSEFSMLISFTTIRSFSEKV